MTKRQKFVTDESGAVTIDFLPILAVVILASVVLVSEVGTGSSRLGGNVSDTTGEIDIAILLSGDRTSEDQGAPADSGDNVGGVDPLPPIDGPGSFVPGDDTDSGGAGNGCGVPDSSCSGLGDGTNPGSGSDDNDAGDTPGGTGTDNPGGGNDDGNGYDDNGNGHDDYGDDFGGGTLPDPDPLPQPDPQPEPEPVQDFDYVFADLVINHNGWATTAVSNWVNLGNILPNTMDYTITGPGNPTAQAVNGQQLSSHQMRWGTNIRMDVPPAGESYTAILNVGDGFWTAAFTVRRLHDPNAMPGPGAGGNSPDIPENPDFVIPQTTIGAHYTGHVYSAWQGPHDLPFAVPVNFEMGGDGKATLQTANGHATSGQIPSWGTQFRADPPPCGTTGTSVITLSTGEVGIWNIVRPAC